MLGTYGIDYVSILNTSVNVSFSVAFASTVSGLNLPTGVVGVMGVGHTSVGVLPNIFDVAYQKGSIQTNTFALVLLENM